MKRMFAALISALALLVPAMPIQAADCSFVLGFKTLHDAIPSQVGDCKENQHFAANGDAQQLTIGGLLAWRKADNWTAFTDGYRTWINGPQGIQERLNTQRFPWEAQLGARSLPVPIGTSAALGNGFAMTVNSVTPNATALVLAENQFNSPPAAGKQFFMAKVTIDYGGGAPYGHVGGDSNFRAVGSALNVAYSPFQDDCGVYPDELQSKDIFQGGTLTGNVCFAVSTADAPTLEMYHEATSPDEPRVYFSLTK